MTPEEVELLVNTINKAMPDSSSNIPIYLLISLIPLGVRYYKKYQERSIKAVVDSSNENFNKILEQQKDSMDQVITSMAMYTEEVVAIHENHEQLKEKVEEVKERVDEHRTWLDKIRADC